MSDAKEKQSKKHSGGKRRHYLTEYIITTDEYVNPQKPNDKYCYCRPFGGKEQAENILNSEKQPVRLDYQEESSDEENMVENTVENMVENTVERTVESTVIKNKTNKTNISFFLARTPTISEQARFEDQILSITVANGWSFRWVEDKKVIAHYNWLNPHLRLPNRKQLAGRILKTAVKVNKSYIQDKARNDLYGVMIAFDGWKNVVNQEILGSVLITSNGEALVWNAIDISGYRKI
ncbi:11382_t:CDS:2 [Gigaspora rosea]|nr:11382_t:CDS:2 [Gigaspora rosea]